MPTATTNRRPARASTDAAGANERGVVTLWLVTAAFAMTVLAGLAVDLGGQVHAKQRAQDIAAQAARAGGQALQAGPAIRGQAGLTDPGPGVAAARAYLAAAPDVTGHARIAAGGTTVTVDTASTYTTQFLSIVGIGRLTVTGHAEAGINRTIDGTRE
jgi:Flp pilus assembly protein TadG